MVFTMKVWEGIATTMLGLIEEAPHLVADFETLIGKAFTPAQKVAAGADMAKTGIDAAASVSTGGQKNTLTEAGQIVDETAKAAENALTPAGTQVAP